MCRIVLVVPLTSCDTHTWWGPIRAVLERELNKRREVARALRDPKREIVRTNDSIEE